jgi:hypothetical protein
MEGYLEIFGRIFCGKKGNVGLWRRKLFFWEWKHWVQTINSIGRKGVITPWNVAFKT